MTYNTVKIERWI